MMIKIIVGILIGFIIIKFVDSGVFNFDYGGFVGSIIAVIGAWWVAKIQIDESRKDFENQLQKQMNGQRTLEKELFFRKSRFDSLTNILNALDLVIEALNNLSSSIEFDPKDYPEELLKSLPYIINNNIMKLINSRQHYEAQYNKLIKTSYFNYFDEIMIERELFKRPILIKDLISFVSECYYEYEFGEFQKLFPAIYFIVYINLSIIYARLSVLININNLYFTDEKYNEAMNKTLIDVYKNNIKKLETDLIMWEELFETQNYEEIKAKQIEFKNRKI